MLLNKSSPDSQVSNGLVAKADCAVGRGQGLSSQLRRGGFMKAVSKWLAVVLVVGVVVLNSLGLIGAAMSAGSVSDIIEYLSQTYSPFNIWTHGLNILLLMPSYFLYKYSRS